MGHIERKDFSAPDETRPFADKGRVEVLEFDAGMIGRGFFEPGWRWSANVKPIANTESCQAAHTCYVLQGRMHIETDDGESIEMGPGDVVIIPPGHDAWTVGDETCILLDFSGIGQYAVSRARPPQEEAPKMEAPEAQPSP